jgi:elongation factor G
MLDRERADFFRTLGALQEQLSDRCVAIQLPIGSEHELTGIVDLLHNCAYMDPGAARGEPVPIPESMDRQRASTARSCSTPSSRPTRT